MLRLGFAMTGSFCTFDKVFPVMEGYDDTYRLQLKEVIKEEIKNDTKPLPGSFTYNVWQA